MNDLTDQQLLRDYAEHQSETAFAELVRRHVDLVYSAALRMVCDPHLAQDVTQAVFVALSQNAGQLLDRPVLSGWLHRTAQNLAANVVRTDVRRRAREREAVAMNELLAHESDAAWENIAPHLDTALGELSEPDRDALLLRYFERKSAREMAQTLNVSEEAAQKRVNRAVERLREFFSKRNVTIGASGLVVLISANAVQAAPIGLIVTVSSALSLALTAVQTSTAIAAAKTIVMTTLQKTLITGALVVASVTGIYEAHRVSNLKKEILSLRQENSPAADYVKQLQQERDTTAQKLAALREDNERLNRNSSELLKLRSQVAAFKAASLTSINDPLLKSMEDWATRATKLKQHFEKMPEARIPEFDVLNDIDWLDAVKYPSVDAVGQIKEVAKETFALKMSFALRKFIEANSGELPTQLAQLKPFFLIPVGDEVLERYEMLRSGNVKDVPERARKCALISEKKSVADNSTQTMIQIGDSTFQNLSSY